MKTPDKDQCKIQGNDRHNAGKDNVIAITPLPKGVVLKHCNRFHAEKKLENNENTS